MGYILSSKWPKGSTDTHHHGITGHAKPIGYAPQPDGPIAEDITHLCHWAWDNQASAQPEDSLSWVAFIVLEGALYRASVTHLQTLQPVTDAAFRIHRSHRDLQCIPVP